MFHNNYNALVVGKKIRAIRKKNGMTQEELASKLFLSADSISNFETGKQTCMPEHMMHVCEIFGVKMDYFYFEDELYVSNSKKCNNIIDLISDCDERELIRVEKMIELLLDK